MASPNRFISRGEYMWPSRTPMFCFASSSVTLAGDMFGKLKQNVGTRSWIRSSVRHAVDGRAAIVQHTEHFERKRFFVGSDGLERALQSGPPRFRFLALPFPACSCPVSR